MPIDYLWLCYVHSIQSASLFFNACDAFNHLIPRFFPLFVEKISNFMEYVLRWFIHCYHDDVCQIMVINVGLTKVNFPFCSSIVQRLSAYE